MNDEKRLKAVEWFKNRAKNCPMPATRRMYEIAIEALEEPKVKNRERLTNAEWVDFLSEQFNISRTSAKEMLEMLYVMMSVKMMSVKKEDNFKKLFSQD